MSWVDYARGIAIILVVYRHVFEGLKRANLPAENFSYLEHANIVFFSFRMPLFFIVSGIFIAASLAKRSVAEFIVTKCKVILYPYFLWGIIQITLQILLSGYVNADKDASHYLYLLYVPREVEQFWYLYALFNVSVIYAFMKVKAGLTARYQVIIGGIMFFISAYNSQYGIDLGFVNDILHYYLFFGIGEMLAVQVQKKENARIFASWKTFFILLPIFIASQLYFLLVNLRSGSEKYLFVEYYQPLMYIIIALAGCAFMMNISFLLQRYGKAAWLRFTGEHSLYIYVTHVLVASGTRIILNKFFGIENVPLLLAAGILMGIIVPIIFYQVTNKLGMYWLFTLERKQKLRAEPKAPAKVVPLTTP